jgi:hypothetical protein
MKHAAAWTCTAIVVALLAIVGVFQFGPPIEDIIAPLYTNVTATIMDITEDETDIVVTGIKLRSCQLISADSQVKISGKWIQGRATFMTIDRQPLTIDRQRIPGGSNFVRVVRITPAGTHIKVKVESFCHPFWLNHQELFELDTSKTPAQVR